MANAEHLRVGAIQRFDPTFTINSTHGGTFVVPDIPPNAVIVLFPDGSGTTRDQIFRWPPGRFSNALFPDVALHGPGLYQRVGYDAPVGGQSGHGWGLRWLGPARGQRPRALPHPRDYLPMPPVEVVVRQDRGLPPGARVVPAGRDDRQSYNDGRKDTEIKDLRQQVKTAGLVGGLEQRVKDLSARHPWRGWHRGHHTDLDPSLGPAVYSVDNGGNVLLHNGAVLPPAAVQNYLDSGSVQLVGGGTVAPPPDAVAVHMADQTVFAPPVPVAPMVPVASAVLEEPVAAPVVPAVVAGPLAQPVVAQPVVGHARTRSHCDGCPSQARR